MGIFICSAKKNQYSALKHELSEYKRKCNTLEKKNKALMQALNKVTPVLPSSHHDWDYKHVCYWIIQIENGTFEGYKDVLLENLRQEDISGKDLCQLDIDDLFRLGITRFMDQKLLLSHIQKLTENDVLPQYQYDSMLPFTIHTPSSLISPQKTIRYALLSKTRDCDITSIKLRTSSSEMNLLTESVLNLLSQSSNKWRYKDGVLSVKIIKATDVSDINVSGCYIELDLSPYNQKEQTNTVSNDINPVWNERFQLFTDNPKTDVLLLKIKLKSRWIFDKTVGTVAVPIADVLDTKDECMHQEFDIEEGECGGKLHLELRYRELASTVM